MTGETNSIKYRHVEYTRGDQTCIKHTTDIKIEYINNKYNITIQPENTFEQQYQLDSIDLIHKPNYTHGCFHYLIFGNFVLSGILFLVGLILSIIDAINTYSSENDSKWLDFIVLVWVGLLFTFIAMIMQFSCTCFVILSLDCYESESHTLVLKKSYNISKNNYIRFKEYVDECESKLIDV